MSDAEAGVALERVEPDECCNARTTDGGLCKLVAGTRTTHVGQGRCWLHGGRNRIKHGRYSKLKRQRIKDLIEEMAGDDDPLDTLDDIAAVRALTVDYIERYDENCEALSLWYETARYLRRPLPADLVQAFGNVVDEWEQQLRSSDEPSAERLKEVEQARKFVDVLRGNDVAPRPAQVLDLAEAHQMLGEVARMVERVHKARSINAISRPEMNRIMQEMWRSIELRVGDQTLKDAIREDWMTVAL